MNYTVCWRHYVVTAGSCFYCDAENGDAKAIERLEPHIMAGAPIHSVQHGHENILTCGFCNTSRPLVVNRCPLCRQWEIEHHESEGRACPAPSREDAHMIRLMLRSALKYVPGVKWSRI